MCHAAGSADVAHGETRRADVVIIGAGPAGAGAALDLARAGLSVLVVERRSFPRDKPCAGALTTKAVARLRFPIDEVARGCASEIEVRVRGRSRLIRAPGPVATMTLRRELDALCLRHAVAAGAEVLAASVAGLEEDDDRVLVTTGDGRRLEARYVIGADGASSRTRRLIGVPEGRQALAIEGIVPAALTSMPALMMFDVAAVEGGYGWIFAKGDHLNVGLYVASSVNPLRKDDLIAFARRVLGAESVEGVVGHPLGITAGPMTLGTARVLLAGDAAGTAENLLGEEIHNAVASGQAAAEAIHSSIATGGRASDAYRRLMVPVLADLRMSARLTPPFYAFPEMACAIMAFPPVGGRLARGFASGVPLDRIIKGSWASPPLGRFRWRSPLRRGAPSAAPSLSSEGLEQ